MNVPSTLFALVVNQQFAILTTGYLSYKHKHHVDCDIVITPLFINLMVDCYRLEE